MVGGAPEQGRAGERRKDALDTSVPVLKMGRTTHVLLCMGINKSTWRMFYTRSQGDPGRSLCSLQLLGLSPRFFWKMQDWNED